MGDRRAINHRQKEQRKRGVGVGVGGGWMVVEKEDFRTSDKKFI